MAVSPQPQNWRELLAIVKRDFGGWQFWVTLGGIFVALALCRPTVAFLCWTCLRLGNPMIPWIAVLGGIFAIGFTIWDTRRRGKAARERRRAGLERLPTQWLRTSWCLWLILLGAHGAVAVGVWQTIGNTPSMVQDGIDYEMKQFRSGNLGW